MTPDYIVSRLRAAAVAGKATQRPPMPVDLGPDDTPEPSLAETCAYCGTDPSTTIPCGEPCGGCGAPIVINGSRGAWHVHGRAEGTPWHRARPVPREVKL